jgi:hypothetical protein
VSPLKSCNVSMVFRLSDTTELSSLMASSTMRRLGDFFLSRIAVLKSFLSFPLLQSWTHHRLETIQEPFVRVLKNFLHKTQVVQGPRTSRVQKLQQTESAW